MMRTRLRPDKRSVAILAAALVGTLAGGGALLYQQEHTLSAVIVQLHEKEKQRDESARLASRLADTELRLKEDTDRLKFLEASLPDMAYVPTLLKQIEQLGKDTHNQVRGVRPDMAPAKPVRPAVRRTDPEAQENDGDKKAPEEQPKPEPYTRLPIVVSLTGTYKDYQSFLQRLTQFPKIVAVDKVQLRPHFEADQTGGSPKLEVEMQLTAFILKEGAAAQTPAAGGPPPATTTISAAPDVPRPRTTACLASLPSSLVSVLPPPAAAHRVPTRVSGGGWRRLTPGA
jgi:Tfp pilus assembly protein PilO